MGFAAKAGVILTLLVVPLLVSIGWLVADRQAALKATRAERMGLAAVQFVLPAMEATQMLRRGLVDQANGVPRSDLGELKDKFASSMEALDREVKPRLDQFQDQGEAHWREVMAARSQASSQAPGLSAAEVRKPYVAMSGALRELVQHLVDESGLALDPEGDSYYLVMASAVNLPELMESMGLTRAAVASYLTSPKSSTMMAAAVRLALDKEGLKRVADNLEHAQDFNPGLAELKLGEPLAAAQGFIARGEALVAAESADASSAPEVVKQATAAILGLGQMQRSVAAELDSLLQAREDKLNRRMLTGAAVSAVLLLAGLYFFYCFYRVMHSGMRTLVRRMHAMASGDLTDTLIPKGRDETATLLGALAEMQSSLRSTVRDVRSASNAIIRSASEVASGSMDLSQRTEQAAANLEETASAMEQISSTVSNTTDGAAQAAGVAARNVELAHQGGQVIGQVVGTMSDIQESSRRIGEIIGVIDGIAFQTNILALNAAVEAARAGEQGRGFAVVAGEVRSLAQRSADAAREIKQLILASGERVEVGNRIVSSAGTTIGAIVESTGRVGDLLQTIANGAREQALGIDQVGRAIHELDQMTQQNAALVEETAAASATMRQHAEQLAQAVGVFKLPA
ncbi:methyl-accepting chemotaxis protein [Ideonella sp.]|uniref:methyl-accepting chemotaxis protein n=1 Tax=Ideonella sp. TaxID=1929293 RepID=UPI003BB71580